MHIALCLQNQALRQHILAYIKDYPFESVSLLHTDEYANIYQLYTQTSHSHYDLIFIDTHDYTYQKNLYTLQELFNQSMIIFISDYLRYMETYFHTKSFFILITPIHQKQFNIEFKKALMSLTTTHQDILFKTSLGQKFIHADTILYLETSYENYKLCTLHHSYYGRYKHFLKIKKMLLQYPFYRLSRSLIINFEHIESFTNHTITMTNKKILNIPRKKRKDFQTQYTFYMHKVKL